MCFAMLLEEIAKKIKSIRISKGMTQQKFADTLGYDLRTIQRYEKDGTKDLEVLNLICNTFDQNLKDILH